MKQEEWVKKKPTAKKLRKGLPPFLKRKMWQFRDLYIIENAQFEVTPGKLSQSQFIKFLVNYGIKNKFAGLRFHGIGATNLKHILLAAHELQPWQLKYIIFNQENCVWELSFTEGCPFRVDDLEAKYKKLGYL